MGDGLYTVMPCSHNISSLQKVNSSIHDENVQQLERSFSANEKDAPQETRQQSLHQIKADTESSLGQKVEQAIEISKVQNCVKSWRNNVKRITKKNNIKRRERSGLKNIFIVLGMPERHKRTKEGKSSQSLQELSPQIKNEPENSCSNIDFTKFEVNLKQPDGSIEHVDKRIQVDGHTPKKNTEKAKGDAERPYRPSPGLNSPQSSLIDKRLTFSSVNENVQNVRDDLQDFLNLERTAEVESDISSCTTNTRNNKKK